MLNMKQGMTFDWTIELISIPLTMSSLSRLDGVYYFMNRVYELFSYIIS